MNVYRCMCVCVSVCKRTHKRRRRTLGQTSFENTKPRAGEQFLLKLFHTHRYLHACILTIKTLSLLPFPLLHAVTLILIKPVEREVCTCAYAGKHVHAYVYSSMHAYHVPVKTQETLFENSPHPAARDATHIWQTPLRVPLRTPNK